MAAVVEGNELEVGPANPEVKEDDSAIALLDSETREAVEVRKLGEDVAVAEGDDEVDVAGKTVVVAITDVSVDIGTALAVSVGNKLNCLEKDVVEVLDKEARSSGGAPGAFGTAATEPICLPVGEPEGPVSVAEDKVETVRFKERAEGMVDVVEIVVGFPVATPCPTRLVEMASKLVEDVWATWVPLCIVAPEVMSATDDREEVAMKEVEREASPAIEEVEDIAAGPAIVD